MEEEKGTVGREKAREERDRKTKMQRCMKTPEERERVRGRGRQTETYPETMFQQTRSFPPAWYPAREMVVQTDCQAGPSCPGRAPPAPRGPFPSRAFKAVHF